MKDLVLFIGVNPVNEESPMNIVVEGPDNAGKSTLIRVLHKHLGWGVVASRGPCKSQLDFVERYQQFRRSRRMIYDRHSCVSEAIYGPLCDRGYECLNPLVLRAFYADPPIFIYCRGRGFEGHKPRLGIDTPEHLAAVKARYHEIEYWYEKWARCHADIWYDSRDYEPQEGETIFNAVDRGTRYIRRLLRYIIKERENGVIRPCPGHRRVPQEVWTGIPREAARPAAIVGEVPGEVPARRDARIYESGGVS